MADEIDNIAHDCPLINKDYQYDSNCDVNHQSQQLLDGKLEASWFSPPITSTQIVSFDLLSLDEDDSQDELISSNEKQNILAELSVEDLITSDEMMQFTDSAYLLALSPLHDQTNISETPPPQGELINWSNTNVTDYLFNSNKLINAGSSNKTSLPTIKAPLKRLSLQDQNKKPTKIKKSKIEGYSCKLNGTMYQVVSRDLDVLESIERGLKVIQEKVHQKGMCYVRSLCLQLNQIETVLNILDDDQLELGMPLEAWNEMMVFTKAMFHETQVEVDLCKKRSLALDTFTDELTTSFSHSFNISGSKQVKHKSSQQLFILDRSDLNTEKNFSSTPDVSPHFESQILKTNATVEIEQEENEIQIIGASHKFNNTVTKESKNEIPKKTLTKTTVGKRRSLINKNKDLKKNSSNQSCALVISETFERRRQSILNQRSDRRMNTSIDNFQGPGEVDLNVPFTEDTTFDIDLSLIQQTSAIPRTDFNATVSEDYLETLPNTFSSILDENESLLPSRTNLQVKDSQLNHFRVTSDNCVNSSQQTEEIVIAEKAKADYQDESFMVGASLNSTLSLFRGNGSRLPKIVTMGFNLRPFILKGVLSPGKNNMKMNINNRIYIASLAPDGTIEMNGFSFPTIGNWIKSVEGKRFGELTRTIQKTLVLQYNGKPLEEVLEVGEKLKASFSTVNDRIPPNNSTLQAPKVASNASVETVSGIQKPIQNPTPDPSTADERVQNNAEPSKDLSLNTKKDLHLVPDEMTRHIKTIFLHAPDEYFPICQCFEQFWCGAQPFPKHLLDEVDSW